MNKVCTTCDTPQRIENFYKNSKMKDGYLNRCKSCEKESRKEQQRDYHLNKRYGLTKSDVDAMYEAQEGVCKICAVPLEDYVIDHCHAGGHVRGLLCQSCNKGLGFFRDNTESLLAAVRYLDGA